MENGVGSIKEKEDDFETFTLQIAGHLTPREDKPGLGQGIFLRQKSTGHVFKPLYVSPLSEHEVEFYSDVSKLSDDDQIKSICNLIPHYYGIRRLTFNSKSNSYIEMEDVTAGFSKPCILDVKIGAIGWDPGASPEKIESEKLKYPFGWKLGFRFSAMRSYDNIKDEAFCWDKQRCLNITESSINFVLSQYFGRRSLDFQVKIVTKFLSSLNDILQWFTIQRRYQIFRSSVLFVYEGDDTKADQESHSVTKMIDFSHIFKSEQIDSNYIKGLKSLINYLDLYRQHCLPS